ncbi:mitochondrial 39-S ribosomal protein L47 (MRP-L47)-domain-containing protein [Astrocystis sublimbata]|nr:mitochondrial 39-S ribosomal protein L47 (MRP-L47)-domain-containing protein [Astrocystis sublimbata]
MGTSRKGTSRCGDTHVGTRTFFVRTVPKFQLEVQTKLGGACDLRLKGCAWHFTATTSCRVRTMASPGPMRPSLSSLVHCAKRFPGASVIAWTPHSPTPQKCCFSSTPEYNNRRPRRDNNRLRGLSSIYRSGTRFRMNIDKSEIPKPAKYKPKIEVDPNHGLWDFFYSKDKALLTPDENAEHGRGWAVEELRNKSWEDLHKLWWACIKEQNRLVTARKERNRLELPRSEEEGVIRLAEVHKTMGSIRHALTERWYVWEDARKLAEKDPEIDLSNVRSPFTPTGYLEEHDIASEGSSQGGSAEQIPPSGFMAEEPRGSIPSDAGSSTTTSKPAGAQQPTART